MTLLGEDRWWHLFGRVDDVSVFHVDLVPHEGREAEALGWLDEQERSRRQSFGSLDARRRFVLCRAALRAIVCRRMGCANESLAFVATEHGKPVGQVDGNPVAVSFNVSHSGRHGMIAVAPGGRIGVDVEDLALRRHDPARVIRAIAGPSERADLEGLFEHLDQNQGDLDQNQRDEEQGADQGSLSWLRLWTLKEAVAKAEGGGISSAKGLSRFEIPLEMWRGATSSICRFPSMPGTTWRLDDLSTGEFAAAMAHEVR